MLPSIVRIAIIAAVTFSTGFGSHGDGESDPSPMDEPPLPKCIPDDNNPYTGYRWKADLSICVPGFPTIKSWYTPAPEYIVGNAVWYAPFVMEATAAVRGLDLDGYIDGVALMSPADIGRTVWLKRPGHTWEGPFLVVDCAARNDIYPVVVHRGEVVEIGFQTAAKWGMVNATKWDHSYYSRPYTTKQWILEGVEVIVSDDLPDWAIYDLAEPILYSSWWADRLEFSNGPGYDPLLPVQIKPSHTKFPGWIWRNGTYPEDWIFINAYDDWNEFLHPGDPLYDLEEPEDQISVVLWRGMCPGY